jgi:hypothetical protein
LRISRNKTEYREHDFGGRFQEVKGMKKPMTIIGDVIREVENFKYLVSFVQKDRGRGVGMDIKQRIKCSWLKWREVLGILSDKSISMRL